MMKLYGIRVSVFSTNCYLVKNEETGEGFLIDPGDYAEKIIEVIKEKDVKLTAIYLTHGHLDHIGSWDQFEKVYLHPADWEKARAITIEPRIASGERMRGQEGDPDVWHYDPENFREWKHVPEILELADGQEFDLGDRKIRCVHTPGHSAGSCSFIDPKSRILFSGDACNVSLRITDCDVETALEGLMRLKAQQADFDRNFNGHLAYASGVTHICMPETCLDDCITSMETILTGKAEPIVQFQSKWANRPMVASYICGAVTVTYCPEKLRKGEA